MQPRKVCKPQLQVRHRPGAGVRDVTCTRGGHGLISGLEIISYIRISGSEIISYICNSNEFGTKMVTHPDDTVMRVMLAWTSCLRLAPLTEKR